MSAHTNPEAPPRSPDTAALARTVWGVTAGSLVLSSFGPLASVGVVLLVRPWATRALGPRADHALAGLALLCLVAGVRVGRLPAFESYVRRVPVVGEIPDRFEAP